jgi:hypothetical protein
VSQVKISDIFEDALSATVAAGRENPKEQNMSPLAPNLATTFLVVLETRNTIRVGYLGNGCLFHVRGNYSSFVKRTPVPWNLVNLLNPHAAPNRAGEAELYGYLCDEGNPLQPTLLEIGKDRVVPGETIIAGTDGLFSEDEAVLGRGGNEGTQWYRQIPQSVLSLWRLAGEVVSAPSTAQDLREQLQAWIEETPVDDDLTVGILTVTGSEPTASGGDHRVELPVQPEDAVRSSE